VSASARSAGSCTCQPVVPITTFNRVRRAPRSTGTASAA
jgi:hypothetical protein